jgi:hypothetical protein
MRRLPRGGGSSVCKPVGGNGLTYLLTYRRTQSGQAGARVFRGAAEEDVTKHPLRPGADSGRRLRPGSLGAKAWDHSRRNRRYSSQVSAITNTSRTVRRIIAGECCSAYRYIWYTPNSTKTAIAAG